MRHSKALHPKVHDVRRSLGRLFGQRPGGARVACFRMSILHAFGCFSFILTYFIYSGPIKQLFSRPFPKVDFWIYFWSPIGSHSAHVGSILAPVMFGSFWYSFWVPFKRIPAQSIHSFSDLVHPIPHSTCKLSEGELPSPLAFTKFWMIEEIVYVSQVPTKFGQIGTAQRQSFSHFFWPPLPGPFLVI